MKCLENVGLLRTDYAISFNGRDIASIRRFLNLASWSSQPWPTCSWKNNIVSLQVSKDSVEKTPISTMFWNHQECCRSWRFKAISYTTGVPAWWDQVVVWKQPGVYNEELDPDPFMEALNEYGLPWVCGRKSWWWTNEVRAFNMYKKKRAARFYYGPERLILWLASICQVQWTLKLS